MLKNFVILVIAAIAIGGSLAMLAASCGPPVKLPDCPPGTVSAVCQGIGTATCHPPDSLEPVFGCNVHTTSLGVAVTIECVPGC